MDSEGQTPEDMHKLNNAAKEGVSDRAFNILAEMPSCTIDLMYQDRYVYRSQVHRLSVRASVLTCSNLVIDS